MSVNLDDKASLRAVFSLLVVAFEQNLVIG